MHLSLRVQLLAGFGIVVAILFAVGGIGYRQVSRMTEASGSVMGTIPMLDAAMEMKFEASRSMHMTAKLLGSSYPDEVATIAKDAGPIFDSFAAMGSALLSGGEIEGMSVSRLTQPELRAQMEQVISTFEQELRPNFTLAAKAMAELTQLRLENADPASIAEKEKAVSRADLVADAAGERIFTALAAFEGNIRTGMLGTIEDCRAVERVASSSALSGMAIGGVVATLLGLWLSRSVVLSTEAILGYVNHVAAGDLNAKAPRGGSREFTHLTAGVKRMVGELKTRLGFAQGLLAGLTIPYVVADPEGRISQVNQSWLKLLGKPGAPADYLGTSLAGFVYGDPSRATLTSKVMQDRAPVIGRRIELGNGRGSTVTTRADASPLFDLDGNLIGAFTLLVDLTEEENTRKAISDQHERMQATAREASEVADRLAASSGKLLGLVGQASTGSEEQQVRLSESATAMEQMNASVLEVARSAADAATLADAAKRQAEAGASHVEEVSVHFAAVAEATTRLRSDASMMGSHAEGAGRILGVIEDIADQTNLLALNAAIEAARAGDAGRGFAVVADEVRKLAEKTMNATREVSEAINRITGSARTTAEGAARADEAVQAGRTRAAESAKALDEIVKTALETAGRVAAIATAAEEQSAASEQVTRGTAVVSRIAGETAQAMTSSHAAVEELTELAGSLRVVIAEMNGKQR